MARKYTKVEQLTGEVLARKKAGETYREIGESYGLNREQVEQLVARYRRKQKAIANGYVPLPKGCPRKDSGAETEEIKRNNEIVKLQMENELLRNFLCEAGRR